MAQSGKKKDPSHAVECSNCLAVDLKLSACTGCFSAQYCGKPCQQQHWRSGHKQYCKPRSKQSHPLPFASVANSDSARRESAVVCEASDTKSTDFPACAICLDSLLDGACTGLRCSHLFHSSCLSLMFPRTSQSHGEDKPMPIKCPQCRTVQSASTMKPFKKSEVLYAVTFQRVRSGKCSWEALGATESAYMEKAVRSWEHGATSHNDPVAKYYLGLINFEGHGVPKDYRKGLAWTREAATDGVVCAQGDLGRRYFNGLGVQRDKEESMVWTLKAAENGHAESQMQMGFLELRPVCDDSPRSESFIESLTWITKAAKQGLLEAELHVAKCHYYGQGTTASLVDASEWFLRAARRGQYDAQLYIGLMYFLGEGVDQNYDEAYIWLVKASEQGPHGQYLLAMALTFGRGVELSLEGALVLLRKAANYGHPGACYQLAVAYGHGHGVPVDSHICQQWVLEALELGYWEADNWPPSERPSPSVGIKLKNLSDTSLVHWAMWFRHAKVHKKFTDCKLGKPLCDPWKGYMEGGSLKKRNTCEGEN